MKPTAMLVIGLIGAVLFGARKASTQTTPPTGPFPPAGPSFPHTPATPGQTVPTEPPKPRAIPKMFKFLALHKYEVVVDALAVRGVELEDLARAMLPIMGMSNPDFDSAKPATRAGIEVTRVKMTVNSLLNHEVPLEREQSLAGVGSIWLVSAVEKGKF